MGVVPRSHTPDTTSSGERGLLGQTLLLHCQFHRQGLVTEKAVGGRGPPISMSHPTPPPPSCAWRVYQPGFITCILRSPDNLKKDLSTDGYKASELSLQGH